jgi:hypothetical protein
LAKAAKT